MSTFTEEAKKVWESLPNDFQSEVLRSVFCVRCRDAVEIKNYQGIIDDGLLVLNGKCKNCGNDVTRVVD